MLNLMILGSARSGTTSLGYYLMEHPEIYHVARNDFDALGGHQINFPYNNPFSTKQTRQQTSDLYQAVTQTKNGGRPDPVKIKYILNRAVYSIYHPHILFNLSEQLPNLKSILCLRNPVDTLFSTYCALSTGTGVRGAIDRPVDERVTKTFEQWLLSDFDLDQDPATIDISRFSNRLMRGIYFPGLDMLHKLMPKENIHVIPFELHKNETSRSMNQICQFLSIDQDYQFERLSIKRGETEKPSPMNSDTRKWLSELFAPHNRMLFDLLDWPDDQWA